MLRRVLFLTLLYHLHIYIHTLYYSHFIATYPHKYNAECYLDVMLQHNVLHTVKFMETEQSHDGGFVAQGPYVKVLYVNL